MASSSCFPKGQKWPRKKEKLFREAYTCPVKSRSKKKSGRLAAANPGKQQLAWLDNDSDRCLDCSLQGQTSRWMQPEHPVRWINRFYHHPFESHVCNPCWEGKKRNRVMIIYRIGLGVGLVHAVRPEYKQSIYWFFISSSQHRIDASEQAWKPMWTTKCINHQEIESD